MSVYSCCAHVCLRDKRKKNERMCEKKDTAGFRWEIRNISIFITATWKTLECLHPLQQATQRKLAWGQISTVRWPKKERERKRERDRDQSLKWESLMNIYNTDLVGNEGQRPCFQSSKPTHITNLDRVSSGTNLGFGNQSVNMTLFLKREC